MRPDEKKWKRKIGNETERKESKGRERKEKKREGRGRKGKEMKETQGTKRKETKLNGARWNKTEQYVTKRNNHIRDQNVTKT